MNLVYIHAVMGGRFNGFQLKLLLKRKSRLFT